MIPSEMIPADAPASSDVSAARSKMAPSDDDEDEGAGGMAVRWDGPAAAGVMSGGE